MYIPHVMCTYCYVCGVFVTLFFLPQSGIMIDAIFDKSFKIGEMVSVQDTVVITQHRGSSIILCDAKEKNIIGIFDITDLCSIYGR